MRATISLLFGCGLLAGCASLEQCQGVDWYRQGYVDGLTTWYSRIDDHARRCAAQGVTPNAERYDSGWKDGRFDFEHRSNSPN
jgi:hypothetical protein